MSYNGKTVGIFNPDAKIFLHYDLRVLQEILDSIRNEPLTSTAQMLREYEYNLIKTFRLGQDRAIKEVEEGIRKTIEGDIE